MHICDIFKIPIIMKSNWDILVKKKEEDPSTYSEHSHHRWFEVFRPWPLHRNSVWFVSNQWWLNQRLVNSRHHLRARIVKFPSSTSSARSCTCVIMGIIISFICTIVDSNAIWNSYHDCVTRLGIVVIASQYCSIYGIMSSSFVKNTLDLPSLLAACCILAIAVTHICGNAAKCKITSD